MSANRRFFLDVRSSANGVAWEHRLNSRDENLALAIAQGHGLPDLVARILAGRGVSDGEALQFLDPTIRSLLPDPEKLTGMKEAAARLAAALERREGVAIFGDYDVDGAASAALLKRFFAHYGLTAEIYIPDRIFEGYGPNPEAMRDLASRGAGLIVTVDCGSGSFAAIDAARAAGADVVVLDHHQVGAALPDAHAVVNPNRQDDLSGQGHLCAAGVVFLTLVETAKVLRQRGGNVSPPDLLALLDLVALATVCDVVPLAGVNRAFVAKGLAVARKQLNPGLAALTRVARIGEPLNTFHLAFLIGPRINAGGRVGDAALGARLLATDDPAEAQKIAETLDWLNRERRAMERAMLEEARAEAEAETARGDGPAILVTASERWHPGIVGLIASRLKEAMRRPTFAVAFSDDGVGTGSGRSISGFDLGRLVREAAGNGLLVKGGGHAMAAGITVRRDKLGALRSFFEERAAAAVSRLRDAECLKIDAALAAEGATLELVDILDKAGPFGAGHPAPTLVLPRHTLLGSTPVGSGHLRVELRSEMGGRIRAMAFRVAGTPLEKFLQERRGAQIHVAGSLGANYWNGARRAQFRISDAAAPDP